MTAKPKLTNRNFALSGYGALFYHRKRDPFTAGDVTLALEMWLLNFILSTSSVL